MFFPLSAQLSQPAVSIEGQVSNPPSTSSTEVNSQTIPEKQPSQEVKMEAKMEVDQPEPPATQPEDIPEVRVGQWLLLCGEHLSLGTQLHMLQESILIIRSHSVDFHVRNSLQIHLKDRYYSEKGRIRLWPYCFQVRVFVMLKISTYLAF